jgi:N-acetylmuramoyl-L-alanine amidase
MKSILSILIVTLGVTALILSYQSGTNRAAANGYVSRGTIQGEKYYDISKEEVNDLEMANDNTDIYEVSEKEVVSLRTAEIEITYKDIYTAEEIEILYRITEAEATGQSIESKMNVTSVILNRVNSDQFPDSIKEVVFQKEPTIQFSPIADLRFYNVKITKSTKKAVNYVLENDVTNDALYFANQSDIESLNTQSWFRNNLTFLFKDDSNHSFYK